MARLARVVIPHVPHHITQRGNRRLPIFFSDEDRVAYLQLIPVERWPRKSAARNLSRYLVLCLRNSCWNCGVPGIVSLSLERVSVTIDARRPSGGLPSREMLAGL